MRLRACISCLVAIAQLLLGPVVSWSSIEAFGKLASEQNEPVSCCSAQAIPNEPCQPPARRVPTPPSVPSIVVLTTRDKIKLPVAEEVGTAWTWAHATSTRARTQIADRYSPGARQFRATLCVWVV